MKRLSQIKKQLTEAFGVGYDLEDTLRYFGWESASSYMTIGSPGSHPLKDLAKTGAVYYEVWTATSSSGKVYLYRTKEGKAVYWLRKFTNLTPDKSGSRASELEKWIGGA